MTPDEPDTPRVVNRWEHFQALTIADLLDWACHKGLAPEDVRVSGGQLKWQAPETSEERERREQFEAERAVRAEAWQRRTYAELKAKFEPDIDPSALAEVLDRLPQLTRERRRALGISVREAGRQAGVSFSTLHRVEAGEDMNGRTLAAILRWLDHAGQPWVVSDSKGVEVGQQCAILGRFASADEAAAFIGTLPEYESGRYNLDGPAEEYYRA